MSHIEIIKDIFI